MNKILLTVLIPCCICFVSCQTEINSYAEIQQYIEKPENGFTRIKYFGDKFIKITYLPDTYYKLRSAYEKKDFSDLKNRNNRHFLVSIGYVNQQGNILLDEINDDQEYKKRLDKLNFGFENLLVLHCDNRAVAPVISNYEPTYGLEPEVHINVIFSPSNADTDLFGCEKLEVIFSDEIFFTGVSRFVFETNNLDQQFDITKS